MTEIDKKRTDMKALRFLLSVLIALVLPSRMMAQEAYAVLDGNTLTFYYDNQRATHAEAYLLNTIGNDPGWYASRESVVKVVFHPSFADARPTNTYRWFSGMICLQEIQHLDYLNTSQVISMNGMFYGCSNLTYLNVSSFDTSKVTDMSIMFQKCSGLTSLDVSNFDTGKVRFMTAFFDHCSSLTTLDVSNFNTTSVENMTQLFNYCSSLTALDLSNFVTDRVYSMTLMFGSCSNLTTLDLSNFNTANVNDMSRMFYGCSKLNTLKISNFNTDKVTKLYNMFYGCTELTTLNLHAWNTSQVTSMENLFRDASKLKTIYVGSNWSTEAVTSSANMFYGCSSLVGGEGTVYASGHVGIDYARIDGGPSSPGYFSSLAIINFADPTVKSICLLPWLGWDTDGDGEISIPEAAAVTDAEQLQDAFRYDSSVASTITSFNEFEYFTGLTEIPSGTFSYCTSMRSITLPSSITKICSRAFEDCVALENLVIPESVTEIEHSAFYSYTGIVTLPTTLPTIGGNAFRNCAGIKVNWTTPPPADGIFDIDQFGNISGKLLYVPIGSYDAYGDTPPWWRFDIREYGIIEFADPKVKAICVNNWDTDGDGELSAEEAAAVESWELYDKFKDNAEITSFDELKHFIGLTYLPESAFNSCTQLSSITLPPKLPEIKGWAFLGCSALTSIDIPESVTSIGNSAFYGCDHLTSLTLTLNHQLQTIDQWAFTNTSLQRFTIPASVTSMDNAFDGTSAVVPQYVTAPWWEPIAITENTFPKRAEATLFVPEGQEDAYRNAPYWQDFGRIVAPIAFNDPAVKAICVAHFDSNGDGELTKAEAAAVTSLESAFRNNTEIQSFNELQYFTGLDDGSEYHNHVLEACAFEGCTNLVAVTLPANITRIDNKAFIGCSSLQYVYEMPDGVTLINDHAFDGCSSLGSINLPASLRMVSAGMLRNCSSLRWINIPEGVTYYGDEAFAGCTALTQVKVHETTPPVINTVYDDPFPTRADITLIVPPHTKEAYSSAPYWQEFKNFQEEEPAWLTYTDENGDVYQYEPGYSAQLYQYADNISRTSFTMPSSIGVDGEVYPVTAIARLQSAYLQTLTIPASVTVVKDNGISCLIVPETGFTLKDIYMRGNVPEAGSFADWMVSIKQYNMLMEMQYPGDPTKRVSLKDITLHVPTGLKAAYEAATFWKEFTVVEYSLPSNEAYAVLSTDGETLSFYYDCERSSREGTTYLLNTGSNKPGWADDAAVSGGLTAKVLTAVIDPSFTNARPTSTAYWFRQMNNLASIAGLTYLNTSEVTCMDNMFYNCQNLAELDLSHFNTANVTSMRYMFILCKSLTKLDLSSFDTGKVTSMFDMFESCSRLESINLSSFNTTKVMDMSGMFSGCASLRMLDLTNFSTPALTSTAYMFNGCTDLTAIYVGSGWTMANVNTSAPNYYKKMFANCTSLLGCKGTAYSSAIPEIDLDYARIDGGTAAPGLLSYAPYAVLSTDGETLTLYHDGDSSSKTGTVFSLIDRIPGWYQQVPYVTTVVFDPSFAFARPVSMRAWFYRLKYLTTFEGLQYLNTSEVRDMAALFYACTQLTNLDLTTFNTSKVKDMANMFLFCTGLKTLDLSSFNTSQVKSMFQMFADCEQLTTIYAGDGWTTSALEGEGNMHLFLMADNLVGGNGTTYDDSPYSSDGVDAFYARIDAPGAPGYFTDKNAPKRGDVNGDSKVTIADVTALVNVILGKATAPASGVADVNGDSKVTIADVTALVNIILGGH